ncbi:MAG: Gfo/Idh/MocA family oxidoreductase [Candidatus Hydrogenedentes bacterium]|nr:Gfo/Idh/MocA family oxidoreductase [Candidatus Hydrogenedentota bacterium]
MHTNSNHLDVSPRAVNRRTFLAASAASLAASPILGAPRVSANEKVNVALIGCGGMGLGDLATFLANPEVECRMVCDVDDKHIAKAVDLVEAKRGHKPKTTKDWRRVIDRNDIDAVLVVTPDHWHALPTIYACETGKDVYCEKPLGKTVQEGRAMLDATKKHKRVVQMGTHWRSGRHYCEAVEFVQSGKLGKVRQVRVWAYLDWVGGIGNPPDGAPPPGVDYDMWLGPAPLRPFNPNRFHFNFRWFWDYAGGLMTDWGVHLINIAMWAMGTEPPRSVYSIGSKRVIDDNTETPDTQIAVYDFPTYTLIFEHQLKGGVGIGGRPHGICFSGTDATLTIDEQGWEVVSEPKLKTVESSKHGPGPDARPAHVRNFLDCMKSREQPVENLEIGHFVSTVAHLGNVALRSNSAIRWDPATETAKGNDAANALLRADYRAPWKLPV